MVDITTTTLGRLTSRHENRLSYSLQCTGYIPSPCEGHAAALVDDVMYVFGGRGVDGTNLGDLTAFKLSSE